MMKQGRDFELKELALAARSAARKLAGLSSDDKNKILLSQAARLERHEQQILAANATDLNSGAREGLSSALLDRLTLNKERIAQMATALRELTRLQDPVGIELGKIVRQDGLVISKRRVPIGVICIIYEARPNVTSDAAGLCIKAGNAVVLRGGKEAIKSNLAIAQALQEGGVEAGLPEGAVQLIADTDRDVVQKLVRLEGLIDLVIPRGGEGLIRAVCEHALIPVIKHYKGVCHVYVDREADLESARSIAINAKCQRPGVCNAMETLLVHREVADRFLPTMLEAFAGHGVEIRGDEETRRFNPSLVIPATELDWSTEYLDLIVSIRVVGSLDEAVEHINLYGSQHSDAIVTQSEQRGRRFVAEVDSAAVYVNASTRFTDGGEFGLGAEIGISTDKLHARGPMGLEELTTYKYIVEGQGHIRR